MLRSPDPESDADEIRHLLDELGYPATRHQIVARLTRVGDDDDYLVLVADDQGEIVGLIAAHFLKAVEYDDSICQVIALVVSTRHRRRGVGAALIGAVETEARALACAGIVLGSGDWRDDAHAFYGRLGFQSTGRRFRKSSRDVDVVDGKIEDSGVIDQRRPGRAALARSAVCR